MYLFPVYPKTQLKSIWKHTLESYEYTERQSASDIRIMLNHFVCMAYSLRCSRIFLYAFRIRMNLYPSNRLHFHGDCAGDWEEHIQQPHSNINFAVAVCLGEISLQSRFGRCRFTPHGMSSCIHLVDVLNVLESQIFIKLYGYDI